jgi:hypothetical protein
MTKEREASQASCARSPDGPLPSMLSFQLNSILLPKISVDFLCSVVQFNLETEAAICHLDRGWPRAIILLWSFGHPGATRLFG